MANGFIDIEEKKGMMSELIAAYGEISASDFQQTAETFEQQWQRALTVEDFRKHCKQKLRAIYG